MLLWMKGTVDGMRSMIYSCAFWQDLAMELPPGPEKNHYADLVDFMTPIIQRPAVLNGVSGFARRPYSAWEDMDTARTIPWNST